MQKIFFQNPFFKKQKTKKKHETILTLQTKYKTQIRNMSDNFDEEFFEVNNITFKELFRLYNLSVHTTYNQTEVLKEHALSFNRLSKSIEKYSTASSEIMSAVASIISAIASTTAFTITETTAIIAAAAAIAAAATTAATSAASTEATTTIIATTTSAAAVETLTINMAIGTEIF
jgi:hypothetical protein